MVAHKLDKLAWQKEFMKADLTPSERVAGFVLSVFANAALNQAYPGVHLLAWRTGLTHDTVKHALRGLGSKGWITLVAPGGNQYGKGSANTYALTYPAAPVYRPEPARRNAKKRGSQCPPSTAEKGGTESTPSAKGKGGNEPAPRGAMNLHEGGCSLPPLQGIEQVIENRGERARGEMGSADAGATESNDPTPIPASQPEHRAADEPDQPPPRRCRAHLDTDSPPLCGPCKEARVSREAWDREHAQRNAEQATQRRARDRADTAAARAAVIAACGMCDADGYAGTVVCDHDPGTVERARHGMAAVRAVLAALDVKKRDTGTPVGENALEVGSVATSGQEQRPDEPSCPVCGYELGLVAASAGVHGDCAARTSPPTARMFA